MPNPVPPELEATQRRSRASQNNRSGRRRPAHNTGAGVPARRFGGQLTTLHADAPEFVPSSILPTQNKPPPPAPPSGPSSHDRSKKQNAIKPRRPSLSRSTAPDIATRTHEDIAKGVYECAICTSEVTSRSRVWACHTCWTVFHLGCIKTWSKNEGAAVQPHNAAETEHPAVKQWRCPGCNLPKQVLPSSYTCWCAKEINPKTIHGLPPHSCGQTCGRKREFPKPCPHPCDLLCHAGPCPPCRSMGPQQICFCGKQSTSRRCTETDYDSGWSCGEICGDLMACGEHTCPRPCHEGLCGACNVEVECKCYCGKIERKMRCSEKEAEKESFGWTGFFDCQQICENLFDCGQHRCQKTCHTQDERPPHCPRSVDLISTCPCGKTKIGLLLETPRKSCTDPIPRCGRQCEKFLPCGHRCEQVCHSGDCPPCLRMVSIPCRCGRNTFESVCQSELADPPQCSRVCKATLNCGRHECGEICCSGEHKAAERLATKRKLKPLGQVARKVDDGIEPEHICTRICGKSLKCRNHTCPELCHKGPCNSCKEAIFDDITCHCGRTVIQAPIPCGTRPPPCNFPCQRPKSCDHPNDHNCHSDDLNCPNCPYLTEKACLCGKKTLKNQPCWRMDVFCGLICGKPLKCGSHTCQKLCHRPGECEDDSNPCQQMCGKPKRTCGHPCERTCHAPSACKEDKPCSSKIIITCDCQRKKEEVKCNAKAGMAAPIGRNTSLKCDDECARLERNRKLALALNISDDHTDDHVPYSTNTLNMYLEDIAWAHKQEEMFRLFAADSNEKRLRFPPMKSHQRAFVHNMAEDFGFDGESLDPEPHRHVLIFKTPKFVAAPMKTLAQAVRIKRAALNISAPVSAVPSKTEELKHEFNGFLLSALRFALTEDEVRQHVSKVAPNMDFNIVFMSSIDSIALVSAESKPVTAMLTSLQPILTSEITKSGLAGSVTLCQFDLSGIEPRVVHRQGQITTGGWSKVAAKRAVPAQMVQNNPIGQRPVYTVLGSRLAEAKKKKLENEERLKKQAEEVVDDWEKEVDGEDTHEVLPDWVSQEHSVA